MICGEKLEEITTQKGLFYSRGFSLVMPDVTLNSLNWGTAVLVLSRLLLKMFVTHILSVQFWLLRVSGVSPTYNPSAGTGTDGRCGWKTVILTRCRYGKLNHVYLTKVLVVLCLKSPVPAVTLWLARASVTACSYNGPGLCPGAIFPNERFEVKDLIYNWLTGEIDPVRIASPWMGLDHDLQLFDRQNRPCQTWSAIDWQAK